MQKKFHNLKTVKEITNIITEKNLDVFIADFKMFLELQIKTREIDFSKIEGLEGIALDEIQMGESFRWCDDGEVGCSNITVSINLENPIN